MRPACYNQNPAIVSVFFSAIHFPFLALLYILKSAEEQDYPQKSLQVSQVVNSFRVLRGSPVLQHIAGKLRTLTAVFLFFLRIALVKVTFAPENLAFDFFAA